MCVQGIMREPDFPLSKAVKNKDVMIKVSILHASCLTLLLQTANRRLVLCHASLATEPF
jgi:hypothetical protein